MRPSHGSSARRSPPLAFAADDMKKPTAMKKER